MEAKPSRGFLEVIQDDVLTGYMVYHSKDHASNARYSAVTNTPHNVESKTKNNLGNVTEVPKATWHHYLLCNINKHLKNFSM